MPFGRAIRRPGTCRSPGDSAVRDLDDAVMDIHHAGTSPSSVPRPDAGLARRRPRLATVRVAAWSARHRRLALTLWFMAVAGSVALSGALGGQRSLSTAAQGAAGGESAAGRRTFAAADASESSERFLLVVASQNGSLDRPDGRAAIDAIVSRLERASVTVGGRSVPVFVRDPARGDRAVLDPFTLAAADPRLAPLVISADRRAVLIDARIEGSADEVQAKADTLRPVLAGLRIEHPDLRILAFDTQLLYGDLIAYATGTTGWLLLVMLPVTFLILLIAFRAMVAAMVPLILGVSAVVGAMGLVGIYSHVVQPVGIFAGEFVVLIGLAVAIDYSLFVITRFRSERARGRDALASIEVASATAGRAVFFSGLAVMVSLGSLIMIDDATVQSCAVGSIAVVLVSLAGSLTFLPATLAVLDTRINRGRPPFLPADRGEGRGLWAPIVRAATGRPVVAAIGTAVVLLAAASPLAGLRLGDPGSDLSVMPSSIEAVQATRLMAELWPQGSSVTLDVVVTNAGAPATQAAIGRLQDAAAGLPGIGLPARTSRSSDGTVAVVSFALAGGPNDGPNHEIVRAMRTELVPAAFRDVEATTYVSGDAATAFDFGTYYTGRLLVVVPFVLALSFLLLLVAFRSVAVPIKAIVLNLLSAGAAFGVLVLVFQEGWFGSLTGIRPGVIDASNPVMMFAILFGLSMDYEVFILCRIKEARDRGLPSGDAVVEGVTITSGTVTSAAAIMVCVFAGFFAVGIRNIQEFALGLAVAVLVDATLVRSLLLPSTMKLLGDWNWWLPPFLRWIPQIRIEGGPAEAPASDREPARPLAA
jgi:RND superfamily putative drug exporter